MKKVILIFFCCFLLFSWNNLVNGEELVFSLAAYKVDSNSYLVKEEVDDNVLFEKNRIDFKETRADLLCYSVWCDMQTLAFSVKEAGKYIENKARFNYVPTYTAKEVNKKIKEELMHVSGGVKFFREGIITVEAKMSFPESKSNITWVVDPTRDKVSIKFNLSHNWFGPK